MSDIVERLRVYAADWRVRAADAGTADEAAAEITRLRADREAVKKILKTNLTVLCATPRECMGKNMLKDIDCAIEGTRSAIALISTPAP